MWSENKPFWWPDAQGFVMASVMLIVATCLFYRMTHPSDVDDKVLDMMLTIVFGTAFVAVINYLFGSSRGSAAKEDTIKRIVATQPPPPDPNLSAQP